MNGPSYMAGRDIFDITHMSPKSAVGSTRPLYDFLIPRVLAKGPCMIVSTLLIISFGSLSKSQISYQPKEASEF